MPFRFLRERFKRRCHCQPMFSGLRGNVYASNPGAKLFPHISCLCGTIFGSFNDGFTVGCSSNTGAGDSRSDPCPSHPCSRRPDTVTRQPRHSTANNVRGDMPPVADFEFGCTASCCDPLYVTVCQVLKARRSVGIRQQPCQDRNRHGHLQECQSVHHYPRRNQWRCLHVRTMSRNAKKGIKEQRRGGAGRPPLLFDGFDGASNLPKALPCSHPLTQFMRKDAGVLVELIAGNNRIEVLALVT